MSVLPLLVLLAVTGAQQFLPSYIRSAQSHRLEHCAKSNLLVLRCEHHETLEQNGDNAFISAPFCGCIQQLTRRALGVSHWLSVYFDHVYMCFVCFATDPHSLHKAVSLFFVSVYLSHPLPLANFYNDVMLELVAGH